MEEPKQKFFIYDRKEFLILVLLGIMIALFAFTLGVHFGKTITAGAGTDGHGEGSAHEVTTMDEKTPNRQELNEMSKDIKNNVESAVEQSTHTEVVKTDIKLEEQRAVELPRETKAPTEVENHAKPDAQPKSTEAAHSGKFTLQVGSYPSEDEAQKRVEELKTAELYAYHNEAAVRDKKWYRVYTGEFSTKDQAQNAGEQLKKKNLIATFLVTKKPSQVENHE